MKPMKTFRVLFLPYLIFLLIIIVLSTIMIARSNYGIIELIGILGIFFAGYLTRVLGEQI